MSEDEREKKLRWAKVEGKLRQIAGKLLAWIEHSLPYTKKENYLFKYFSALLPTKKKEIKEGEKPHQNSKISFSAQGSERERERVEGKGKKWTSEARNAE